ncbi:MAG: CAP domain-containing protein [Eubacterium sp.]|nr:CAP domain-containing protein [Eubacterium sp.]
MMKWMKKAGCMALALSVVFSLAEPVQVQAKSKKVKTTNVTLIKGENQCFTFRKLKIKKIKVKYSKKGVVKVKLGKDPNVGRFIQIASKKKGTTLVTVKAYTTKKKYKTLKYKVKVTTHLEIANSKAAKQKAKKAFALQNKYRKEAGVSALEWSDEMYEYGLYRLKTSGLDDHKNADRDEKAYFGDLSGAMAVEKDNHWINENLASHSHLTDATKAWKKSIGHYNNMISNNWKCGAIVQYAGVNIAVFSSSTAEEMKNWRNYKTEYAKVVVKRENKDTGAYAPGSVFCIYDKENKFESLQKWSVYCENGRVLYLKPGKTYVVYESETPTECSKAERVEFIAKPLSEGTNEIVLK